MSSEPRVTAPAHFEAHHDLAAFDCGEADLNDWLRLQALKNEASGASRTYVICADAHHVVGYDALATAGSHARQRPAECGGRCPNPFP